MLAIVRVSENRRTADFAFFRSELGGIELGTSRSQVQRVTKRLLTQLEYHTVKTHTLKKILKIDRPGFDPHQYQIFVYHFLSF